MRRSAVTLTTDFGTGSSYVAAMKGVILTINPDAQITDLCHDIPAQDIGYTAFFLAAAIPHFPAEMVHLVVVDPGVGTERALLYVEIRGHRLLAPDNGCWTELARQIGGQPEVIRLSEPRFWGEIISATFHGRDILAPVAAHLSLGVDPRRLGPVAGDWKEWRSPAPERLPGRVRGEILFVDRFGNLITNIPGNSIQAMEGKPSVLVGARAINQHVSHYAEAKPGTLVWLISSVGLLEVAATNGNAAQRLAARVGDPVEIVFEPPPS
jgi:S-adenosylmethionine hydrolase